MKRIILYIGILAALLAAPGKATDVGKLLPVQAVAIYKQKDVTVLVTDTGNRGIGNSAAEALQNLKETASGILYLDTAEFLLLGEDCGEATEELRRELKDSVRLCGAQVGLDLQEAVRFLKVHGSLPKLSSWNKGVELPVLGSFGDALIFLKKVENNA